MNQRPTASIKYYRWAGEFFGFRIATQCEECDITRAVLGRLMDGPFRDKPVRLNVAPWLNNWWRILWRGAWHAPIIMINGRVFSQGVVPDARALVREVADALGDDELAARAEEFAGKQPAPDSAGSDEEDGDIGITVYFSPACPHCRRLLGYLDANEIRYRPRDVSQSAVARSELQELTDSLALPVIRIGGETISGFDPAALRPKLGLTDETEKSEGDSTRSPAVEYPSIDNGNLKRTIFAAQTVLRENCESGRTRASRHLYPHQWNWDSGFIARGYLHFDPQQAYREIRLLFQGQWSDGFLPHIVFNEAHLEHFPGPDYWKAERSGRVPDGVHTSGIGQPPVHAAMLAAALELDADRDRALGFLREMYPRIRALHQFYYDRRDPSGEHLVFLVHPWESGIDNAPLWDEPLAAVTATSDWARHMQQRYDELAEQGNRPKRSYIEKYSYLVERLFETGYDWDAIAANHPFQIQDVLFNSILCRSERALARIAEAIGENPAPHRQKAERIAAAMNQSLWDGAKGVYLSRDKRSGTLIERDTIFSYIPLYAGIVQADRREPLLSNLRSHCFCVADHDCIGIPTYDMCQVDYQGDFYWRGPVWFNMCWFMVHGLEQAGENELAEWLRISLMRLVLDHGFHEYYEPETGSGLGASNFSWTAALFLDIAAQTPTQAPNTPTGEDT